MGVYLIVRFILWKFSWLPFKIINWLSNGVAFVLHHLIRYRREVIQSNLETCLENLSSDERKTLIKQSYLNLSDVLLESIKGLSLTEQELTVRNKSVGAELIDQYLEKEQSVICVCGHIANWEWAVLGIGYRFRNKVIGIYKQINNPRVESYIKTLRAKCSMKLLTTHETRLIHEDIPKGRVILLMADQNPSNIQEAIWVKFFGKDTACLHGLEKYAGSYQLPVVYMEMTRTKRSNYQMSFSMLCENPSTIPKGELTQMFMSRLEKTILKNPSDWLWSHKRWKHVKENKK
ncbi:MAG: lysophospholipid acyltransferase family protein [Saprospiraceae bacterium]|nr:lysophospholipid acyltransferase family protein [Saprospiraceae bacterium]